MNDKKIFRKQAKRFLKQAMLTLTAGMIGAALAGAVFWRYGESALWK